MEFEGGFYIVSPGAINRVSKNGIMSKGSEIFFFEGNSSPIPFVKPKSGRGIIEPSRKYLDDMIYVNFLEQTGAPSTEKLKSVMKLIQPLTSPATLFKILFVLLIAGTILRNVLENVVS